MPTNEKRQTDKRLTKNDTIILLREGKWERNFGLWRTVSFEGMSLAPHMIFMYKKHLTDSAWSEMTSKKFFAGRRVKNWEKSGLDPRRTPSDFI